MPADKDKKSTKPEPEQTPPESTEDPFEALDNAQLQSALDEAVASFEERSGQDSITEEQLAELRELTDHIKAIKAEQASRREAAEQAQAEIEAMRAEVTEEAAEPEQEDEPAEEDSEEDEAVSPEASDEDADEPVEEASTEPEPVKVAASAKRELNLGEIRKRQKRIDPPSETRGPSIVASGAVPGINAGQPLDMAELAKAVHTTASAIATSKGRPAAQSLVARYSLPFSDDLVVSDDESVTEGTARLVAASDQSRLPGGDLVASGGWCAPSETVYDIATVSCPDMLWGPPEVQLNRGGLRFFRTPALDVDQLAHVWTEEQDIAAADNDETKDCFHVPCSDPEERRCAAIYTCITAGLLTERAFPELHDWYTRHALIAHEMLVKRRMFQAAIDSDITQAVVTGATFGAFTAVFGAVAYQTSDLVEKHSLCESIGVEVTFPWWARNLFLADIARQNGRDFSEVNAGVIATAFGTLGVSVSFARGLPPNVPTNIGGSDLEAGWPGTVPFLIHPAGGFQIGRGDTINLGVVQDSAKFAKNDFTALFVEECVALIDRGPEARFVTVPICPDGVTGGQAGDIDCPIDGGPGS